MSRRALVGIVEAQRGDGSAQNLHGVRSPGKRAQQVEYLGVERTGLCQLAPVIVQFSLRRKLSKPEQVRGLFERRLFGKLVDVDAAVGQHPGVAVNPANTGVGRYYALESLTRYRRRHRF